jgi:hypothetical protein
MFNDLLIVGRGSELWEVQKAERGRESSVDHTIAHDVPAKPARG